MIRSNRMARIIRGALAMSICCAPGCGQSNRNFVPKELAASTSDWKNSDNPQPYDPADTRIMDRVFAASADSREQSLDKRPPLNVLALSGGGMYGAFGVGVLNGWTCSGTRPTFNVVTGISTGALIATYAFLGREYD